jgi:hypothetical protein
LLTQRSISPSTLNILGCCSESGEDGKQSLPTGYTEPDVGTADIKNKADTDFERWKAGAPEQAEVWWFLSENSRHTARLMKKKGQERQLFREQYRNTSNGKSERGNHSRMKRAV